MWTFDAMGRSYSKIPDAWTSTGCKQSATEGFFEIKMTNDHPKAPNTYYKHPDTKRTPDSQCVFFFLINRKVYSRPENRRYIYNIEKSFSIN